MKVLVECYHDWALLRSLGIRVRQLGHEYGKGNVLRVLARWDGEALGVVDADTGKLDSNPGEMANYRDWHGGHGLKLMRHCKDGRKSLILIEPTLEDWLLARANACQLRPRDYGLPESSRAMHKNPRCDRKPDFYRFLSDLAKSDEGMKTLKT